MIILGKSLQIANRTADSLIELRSLPGSAEPLNILTQATSVNQLANLLQEEILAIYASDENTDAIEIVAVSNSAEEASVIAGIYAAEYIRETENMLRENLTKLRLFYEAEYKEKKEELEQIESSLASYMNREGATALDEQVTYLVAQIAQMEAMLETARVELSMGESHLLSLENEMSGLQPILSQQITSDLDAKIEVKQKEIANLELSVDQIYRRNPELRSNPGENPQLREYNQRINQLKSELRAIGEEQADLLIRGGGVDPTDAPSVNYIRELNRKLQEERVNISGKQAQVRGLEQRLGEYDRRLRDIPTVAIELAQLERKQQSTEELFTLFSSKLEQIRIAEESVTGFARIIREAIPPEKPEKPQKAINLILGMMLGLMLGVSVAIARRKFDTKVYSPEDLNHSDINMLGVVPDMRQLIKKEFGKRFEDRLRRTRGKHRPYGLDCTNVTHR